MFGGSDQETVSSQFPPPWPGLGMNPLGPTPRAEPQTDPTVPPLPEEEGEVTAEPEDPSTELLRRMCAGAREPDVSRVKLARTPAPTRSRGLPPTNAWQRLVHDPVEDVGERDQPRSKFWESQRTCRDTAQQTESLRTRSALISTTRCYRNSLAQTCRQAGRGQHSRKRDCVCKLSSTSALSGFSLQLLV